MKRQTRDDDVTLTRRLIEARKSHDPAAERVARRALAERRLKLGFADDLPDRQKGGAR